MAKFDLLTTLTLNAAGFTDGIDKAKAKTKDLQTASASATDGIKSAFNGLTKPLTDQLGGLTKLTQGFGGVGKGIMGMLPSLGALKTAMLAIPLLAIVAALVSLVTWFSKSQEGSNIFTRAINAIKAVVQTVLGTLKMLGEALIKLFKGDFAGAAASAKEAFTGAVDRLKENLAVAKQLSDLMIKMSKDNITYELNISTLKRDASVLQEKMTDKETYSAAERMKFLDEYRKKMESIKDLTIEHIKDEQQKFVLESGGIKKVQQKNDLMKEYNSYQIQINAAEAEYTDAVTSTNKKHHAITGELQAQLDLIKQQKAESLDALDAELQAYIDKDKRQIEADKNWWKAQNAIDKSQGFGKLDTSSLKAIPLPMPPEKEMQKGIDYFQRMIDTINDAKFVAKEFTGALDSISDAFIAMANGGKASFKDMVTNMLDGIRKVIMGLLAQALANSVINALNPKNPANQGTLGIAGLVAAAAGITVVMALWSKLPKFSTGGIMGGNSYSGDHQLARVNAGEMILNQGQQQNLFKSLNTGVAGGGQVTFKIDGTSLVGVLSNYNNRINRIS